MTAEPVAPGVRDFSEAQRTRLPRFFYEMAAEVDKQATKGALVHIGAGVSVELRRLATLPWKDLATTWIRPADIVLGWLLLGCCLPAELQERPDWLLSRQLINRSAECAELAALAPNTEFRNPWTARAHSGNRGMAVAAWLFIAEQTEKTAPAFLGLAEFKNPIDRALAQDSALRQFPYRAQLEQLKKAVG